MYAMFIVDSYHLLEHFQYNYPINNIAADAYPWRLCQCNAQSQYMNAAS